MKKMLINLLFAVVASVIFTGCAVVVHPDDHDHDHDHWHHDRDWDHD